MNKFNLPPLFFFSVTASMPLLSGFDQPLINGLYLTTTLLVAGIWLVLNSTEITPDPFSYRPLPILILLGGITCTTIDLPLEIISSISPVRAETLAGALGTGQFMDITASLSYSFPESRYYAVYGLTLFLLFFFSSALLKAEQNRIILLWLITLTGGLEALLGIGQALFPDASILHFTAGIYPERPPAGTFPDNHLYAAFLNMCWPVSLVLGLSLVKKIFEKIEFLKIKHKKITVADRFRLFSHHAVLPLWVTALIISAVILTGSAPGIAVMFGLVILCRIVIPYPRPVKILFSGIIYSVLLGTGLVMGIQGITSRSVMLFNTAQARISLWEDTLAMLKDHLFTGIGMGAFPFLAPVYISLPDNRIPETLHNDYLEFALELGLPLFLILAVWLFTGLASYGRRIYLMPRRLEKMTRDDIFIIGSFYALTGVVLNAAAAGIFRSPVMAFYSVILLSVLHSILARKTAPGEYKPEYLLLQKKPVRFVPYRKAGRRRPGR